MDGDTDPEIEQNEELQKFLGTSSFGKQSRQANAKRQVDMSKRPAAQADPVVYQSDGKQGANEKDSDEDDDDEDDDDDDDDDDDEDEYPTSHEMIIKTHEKAVTAATLDPAGTRLVTGSIDCTLKFHDFASMTPTTIRAFKSVDPTASRGSSNAETHPVHQVLFNPLSAGHLLVATALPQAKLMTRDGEVVTEFAKGDMYLRGYAQHEGSHFRGHDGHLAPYRSQRMCDCRHRQHIAHMGHQQPAVPARGDCAQVASCRFRWEDAHDRCCMGIANAGWQQPPCRCRA